MRVDTIPSISARIREADEPRDSLIARFGADKPLKLDVGVVLSPFQIAYTTYGTLNAERSNKTSISVPSRISGSCFAAGARMDKAVALNAGLAAAVQCAVMFLESVRREGGVLTEPPVT